MTGGRFARVAALIAPLTLACSSSAGSQDSVPTTSVAWGCGLNRAGCICVDTSVMDLPTNAQQVGAMCPAAPDDCCALAAHSCACVTAADLAMENATCAEFYPPGMGLTPVSTCPPPR